MGGLRQEGGVVMGGASWDRKGVVMGARYF